MNLEYTGITKDRVEDMEDRLRQDILEEAALYDEQILVADEDDAFNVFDMMLRVSEADVQTPKSLFEELKSDGYNVVYNRIPITDEKAPKPSDFDYLLQQVYSATQPAAFVFNCQMGRGRTTTGMVIASMLLLQLHGFLDRAFTSTDTANGATATDTEPSPGTTDSTVEPPWFKVGMERSLQSQVAALADKADATAMMKAGHLLVVRSLLRVLPHSTHAKAALDAVVDACAAMQNLRSIIVRYRANMLRESREDKRAKILSVVTDHIDRYCHLIVFCSYLGASGRPAPAAAGAVRQPFAAFLASYPEIRSVLGRLLWAFPLLTLELDGESGRDKLSDSEKTLEELSDVLAQRKGAVLCASTILKADIYPSLRSARLPQLIDGAPNFRQAAAELPVYGGGICTLLGVQRVLQALGSGPAATPARAAAQRQTLWHNLREEPVLYINGTPYVLREAAGAYTNMKEYSGIDAGRLEALEERLRGEVLQEGEALGGKVQVLYEEKAHSGASSEGKMRGRLQTGFELVLNESAVMTPQQLFASLAKAGYGVRYTRVPITDGKVPGHDDVDAVHTSLASAGPRSNFVFNCQQGKGRTTIGMAMAALYLSAQVWRQRRKFGVPQGVSWHVSSLDTSTASEPGSPRLSALAPRSVADAALATAGSSSSDLEGESDLEASPPKAGRAASPPRSALASAPPLPLRVASPACGRPPPPPGSGRGSLPPGGGGHAGNRTPVVFLGVRRLLGELAEGAVIASWLDRALDAVSHMVHLRDVIGTFRASRQPSAQLRPEFSRLRQAFERDAVALARYCLLLTYAAYLHHNVETKSAERAAPAVAAAVAAAALEGLPAPAAQPVTFAAWVQSLGSIKHALAAPLEDPVRALTPLPQPATPPSRAATPLPDDDNDDDSVSAAAAAQVLAARRFRMLSPSTILKSFHQPDAFDAAPGHSISPGGDIPGVSDFLQIAGQPIWLASNPSVKGLRGLVECLGAKSGSRVVVLDTREELGVYLRGHPYTRRELEMPTASVHHAGIHWRELRKLERWLRDDVCTSSTQWADDSVHRVLVHKEAPAAEGAPAAAYAIEDATDVTLRHTSAAHLTAHWVHIHAGEIASADNGVATAWQVLQQLREEGNKVWYRRLPLSRNRTPDASDMDVLHRCAFAAATPGAGAGLSDVKFLLVARAAATSTSTSFVAHFLGVVLSALRGDGGEPDGPPVKARRVDGPAELDAPNISVVDNLCRVLDHGTACRENADRAIAQLHSIDAGARRVYDVLDSIAACKAKVEAIHAQRTADAVGRFRKQLELSTAKRLGAHYLMRYLLLIAFRAFFQEWLLARTGGGGLLPDVQFSSWFKERKELGHLLRSCTI
eukprot:jgi/Ulvmu1/2173/UM013_0017.1